MNIGDIVVNDKGWQGEVIQISKSHRFGTQCLVQFASRREWEAQSTLYVVVAK